MSTEVGAGVSAGGGRHVVLPTARVAAEAVPRPLTPPTGEVRRSALALRLRQTLIGVFLLDAGVLTVTSVLAWWTRGWIDQWWDATPHPYNWGPLQGPGLIALWLVVLVVAGGYRRRTYGAGFEEFRSITIASVVALGACGFAGFLAPQQPSRGYPLMFFLLGTPVLLLTRYLDRKALHRARARGRLLRRVVAVGSPAAVRELVEVLARAPWMGYRVVGMCTPDAVDPLQIGVPVLGDAADVPAVAEAHRADTVLVAGGSYSSAADLRRLGWALEGLHLEMLVVPSLTDIAGPRVHLRHVAGLPLVQVEEPQADRAGGWVKRAFDLVVAGAILLVLAVPMLVCALVVKLADGGPVFYRQSRVGLHGDLFDMIKFRSMVVGADRLRTVLESSNELDGVLFKIREDPRVTAFGRFMRRYSIDELPQLLNVLRGDMSLVGPRPPLPTEVEQYERDVHRRLLVRPGMTGLWQVSGRSDLTWSESVRLDLYYVDNWSLVTDVVIMLKTIRAVVRSSGAY
jgi:exopolysaccharide biosynthesis polyprenyl glycosylphosphotransferase